MIAEFALSVWFMGLLLGRYDEVLEMPDAAAQVASFAEIEWGPLDPMEAIKWFANKVPADENTRRLIERFLAEEGNSIDDYRQNIFAMAGIENIRLLQVVQDSIRRAIEQGTTYREWKTEVGAYFDAAGYSDQDPWHLETTFRTNLFSAYNAGRYRQGMATAELLPYWQYKAVMDDRTRPSHARMHNFIARKDDPVWDLWFPPNGFNCRCTVISLTEQRAAREDQGMPPVGLPDDGFDGNPGEQLAGGSDLLRDLLKRAEKQYEDGWDGIPS